MPRQFATLALVLGLGLAPGLLAAQNPDKILAQHIAALGGDKALKAITSVEYHGDAHDLATGDNAAFTLDAMAPNMVYIELASAVQPAGAPVGLKGWSEAYNGKSAWRRQGDGAPATLTGAAANQIKSTAFFLNSHFIGFRQAKWAPVLAGHDQVDGRDVDIVELTNEAGDVSGAKRKFYFDAVTHLLLRETQAGDSGDDIVYSDYQPVDGIPEPHHLRMTTAGHTLDIELTEVRHNPALSAHVFDFPAPMLSDPPDVGKLIESLRRRQSDLDRRRRNYSCTEDDVQDEVDGKGQIKKVTDNQYYVFYLGNHQFRKLVAVNGQPLDAKAQAKEDARIDKEQKDVAERQQKALAERDARRAATAANGAPPPASTPGRDDGDIHVRDFLAAMQFYNFRREPFRGQQVLVFDFSPKPNYKPHGIGETIASKLVGTIWIDEQDHEVARIQARNLGAIKVGGGLLASVDSGSSAVLEQEKVNNEVWMPILSEVHLSAHLLLLKSEKENEVDRYTDYKRFTVGTKIIIPPLPPSPP